ncbi:MAG: hypothetical protein LBV41_10760 [Cytophagaceae bacterium]|nr:hypothetical protein [Cytophagaceae bacterium]
MKKRTFLTAFIVPVILLQGCIAVSVSTHPVNSGYLRLSEEDREWIVFSDTAASVCSIEKEGKKIHAITGAQLRQCVEAEEKAMVLLWRPSGSGYYSLAYAQSYCDSLKMTLYVVAREYDSVTRMYYEQAAISKPMFSINEKACGTPGRGSSYNRSFVDELIKEQEVTDKQRQELHYNNRFLFFENGKLTSFSDTLTPQ